MPLAFSVRNPFYNHCDLSYHRKAVPSFILIEYKGSASKLTLYVYTYGPDGVDIGQTDIVKGGEIQVAEEEAGDEEEEDDEEEESEEEEDEEEEEEEGEEEDEEDLEDSGSDL